MSSEISKAMFLDALQHLSSLMAQDPIFQTHGVLKLVVFGGFISVFLFESRPTTGDIDFYHPGPWNEQHGMFEEAPSALTTKLADLVQTVARNKRLASDWANPHVSVFVDGSGRPDDIVRSAFSAPPIYASPQLELYPGDWVFQLVQKLIASKDPMRGARAGGDVTDAAYIAAHICEMRGDSVLKKSWLTAEWGFHMEAVRDAEIHLVNERASALWGRHVIALD